MDVQYVEDTNPNEPGEDLRLVDSTWPGVPSFTVDLNGFGEVDRETGAFGSTEYSYDLDGRLTQLRPPGATSTGYYHYAYDAAGRVETISRGASPATADTTVTIAYDAVGRRDLVTLPNGMRLDYGYTPASQLRTILYQDAAGGLLGDVTYDYDAAGSRTSEVGSWTVTDLPAAVSGATYNAANELTSWAGQAVTYTATGELGAFGGDWFAWNPRGQLTGVVDWEGSAATIWSFKYGPDGRRYEVLRADGLTAPPVSQLRYFYAGENPVRVENTIGAVKFLPGLGLDEWYARWDVGGNRLTYLPDALGSVVRTATDAGTFPATYGYTPFGGTTGPLFDNNSFKFTGRERDPTGLYHLRARYYHPTLRRFLSEDPLGVAGGDLNLHAYVGNDPLNFVDPTGENPVAAVVGACVVGAISSAAINAAIGAMAGRKPTRSEQATAAAIGCGAGAVGGLLSAGAVTPAGLLAIDELIAGSRIISRTRSLIQLQRSGGNSAAAQAFNVIAKALKQTIRTVPTPRGPVSIVRLPGGGTMSLRGFSSGGRPTIQFSGCGPAPIKIRF